MFLAVAALASFSSGYRLNIQYYIYHMVHLNNVGDEDMKKSVALGHGELSRRLAQATDQELQSAYEMKPVFAREKSYPQRADHANYFQQHLKNVDMQNQS